MVPFVSDPDFTLYVGDALDVLRGLPDESVHMCVTSPPYHGLRDYSADGQIGLEATVGEYVEVMVEVFKEVRRVLRNDATLWLNLGDAFQDKQMQGVPWRVAFALQADGWYLRSDIVWSKPNPMPESVTDRPTKAHEYVFLLSRSARYFFDQEAVRERISESTVERWNGAPTRTGNAQVYEVPGRSDFRQETQGGESSMGANPAGRNLRSVWEIATQPYPDAHFATFPEALPERCILAGTSERGCCPVCGTPWERETEREPSVPQRERYAGKDSVPRHRGGGERPGGFYPQDGTVSSEWRPTCGHEKPGGVGGPFVNLPVPCTVLDPFLGSGTTALVARRLGRRCVGIELSPEYARLAAKRLQQLSLLAGEPDPTPRPVLRPRGLTGGAYSPPGQSPHSNARVKKEPA